IANMELVEKQEATVNDLQRRIVVFDNQIGDQCNRNKSDENSEHGVILSERRMVGQKERPLTGLGGNGDAV
ncbi:MAG: hypothetical protein ACI4SV_04180, partial [Duodenibacillus sp.]